MGQKLKNRDIAREVIGYLRSPYFIRTREKLSPSGLEFLLRLILLKFIIVIAGFAAISGLFSAAGLERPESAIETEKLFAPLMIVLVVFIVPMIEEILFRSWLGRKWGIIIATPLFIVFNVLLFNAVFELHTYSLLLAFSLIVGAIYYALVIQNRTHSKKLDSFARQIFPYVFWLSTALFALLHLSNFSDHDLGLIAAFLVFPQFIAGAVYGFVRMKYGFLVGVGCHSFWNGILIFLAQFGT